MILKGQLAMTSNRTKPFMTLALCLGLAACSSLGDLFPDRKNEYKETREIDSLEVPPDLSGATMTTEGVPVRRQQPVVISDDGFDSPYDQKPRSSSTSFDSPATGQSSPSPVMAEPVVQTVAQLPQIQAQPQPASRTAQPAAAVTTALDTSAVSAYVLKADAQPPYIYSSHGFAETVSTIETAIAQAGYMITDRNLNQGSFQIQTEMTVVEPKKSGGLLSKLAFWRNEDEPEDQSISVTTSPGGQQLKIRVQAMESGSRVVVQESSGTAVTGPVAATLLGDIHWQLQ
jgi:uncharacterized lipoprotein